jgi:O-antigen/teichoic acid export membrane protein
MPMTRTVAAAAEAPVAAPVDGSRAVLASVAARLAGFPLTAVAQLLTSRLIIDHYGLRVFSSFSLMLVLIAILPLNAGGIGAAVTSAWAEDGPTAARTRGMLLTAVRSLLGTAAALSAAAAALAVGGYWPRLIGDAAGPNAFIAAGAIIFLVSLVPGVAPNILLGAHRNHVTVVIQSFLAPVALLLVGAAVLLGLDGRWVILAPPTAVLTVQMATALVARSVGVRWLTLLRRVPNRRRHPGAPIRALSGWVFVSGLALPIALQSDRIVLSHVSTVRAVADYTIVFQIFAPVTALIIAAAQPLWPIYTQARSAGRSGPGIVRFTVLFVAATTVVCALLVAVAGPVARFIGGRADVDVGVLLPVSAALLAVVQALVSPLAMTLFDPAGVRVVAIVNVVALPINLGLSIWFAERVGAAGPLLATALVVAVVQAAPLAVYARNRRVPGRHRRPRGAAPPPVLLTALAEPQPFLD